ncbi:hypothetical protein GCM10011297_13580 [Bacterioplanes sanyensis]|uniref:hypothetical protein n=1 Tax=Bacterioplanes sanyensis TaxID=1249553 RepID=UPI00167B0E85|nr:hypothetical protein [Bacterioplanes sanyensis]GGY41850.1 hypothetical protein GCM10011297_13580 [Bacterioplanes sanyensis]
MKLIITISLLLVATATGLTLYLRNPDAAQMPPAFSLDLASASQPLDYADLSLASWLVEPGSETQVGVLVAIVASSDDAQALAQQWQQRMAEQRLSAQPLTLFTLKSGPQQSRSMALVMGPLAEVKNASPYRAAAMGGRFANQLVQWPIAKENTP